MRLKEFHKRIEEDRQRFSQWFYDEVHLGNPDAPLSRGELRDISNELTNDLKELSE